MQKVEGYTYNGAWRYVGGRNKTSASATFGHWFGRRTCLGIEACCEL